MPETAPSVIALNGILDKTSSFASIQIVAKSNNPHTSLQYIRDIQAVIDNHEWVSSSQYFEDISVIEKHKLLLADTRELLDLEQDLDTRIGVEIARNIASASNVPVTIELRENSIKGNSSNPINGTFDEVINELEGNPETIRHFASEDKLTTALVIWPGKGLTSLADAKRMVIDTQAAIDALGTNAYGDGLRVEVAGRIKNKVAQFDAIISDAKTSLGGAVLLIILLLFVGYRRIAAIPCIILPLLTGLLWTLGITALCLGALNLITVFLVLILFGLGIDFGIHNFSRYLEMRNQGEGLDAALVVVIGHTGPASMIAAVTSALGFLVLLLTDFRAFVEFGFIAGMGLIIVFICMYTIFPALLVVGNSWMQFAVKLPITLSTNTIPAAPAKVSTVSIFALTAILLAGAGYAAMGLEFEKNFKNLEAERTAEHQWAAAESKRVFPGGHDRAVLALPNWSELAAVSAYFEQLINNDTLTPTIDKVSSILNYLPDPVIQGQRLAVIHRLRDRVDEFASYDPENADKAKRYVDISELQLDQLPPALRRAYVSVDKTQDYLLYIYNGVSMDDADLAREFYNDAANIHVAGKSYSSASEGFIFVEMIAMMKSDAIKAITLVIITTALLVLLFFRSLAAMYIVLLPPLAGVVLTLGLMVITGQSLSIINMVVLPSLVGIAVDNSIHIYHRFKAAGYAADIDEIMHTTGRAALLTTITTLVSFGGLTTASMAGLRSMGYLAITGFICCMLFTWFLTPALLRRRLKRLNTHQLREHYAN